MPVGNTFEMLSANVWGLMVAVVAAYALLPRLRNFAAVALPVVMLVMAWMLLTQRADSALPPTSRSAWARWCCCGAPGSGANASRACPPTPPST